MAEVCADADWLPKDKKDALRKIALEGVDEESLVLTEETRIPVKFRPCPDCGYSGYLSLDREHIVYSNVAKVISSEVKARCTNCGWRTSLHKTVKECAKEWNEAEV